MRALSLTQPWATLVAVGAKRIETRSWTTRYRGPLAIHAAKGLTTIGGRAGLDRLVGEWPFSERLPSEPLPLGAVVAVAVLRDVWPAERVAAELERRVEAGSADAELELGYGDFTAGRFGWILGDVTPLREAVAWRGSLGLWHLPSAVVTEARGTPAGDLALNAL